jgi:4-hydroxy-tetrahydrodipicolinate reductase
MNIALIGYGKMGKTIERIAVERGHNVVMRINTANKHEMTHEALQNVDVAIEFTRPESAQENVEHCLKAHVSVVCGTTGWAHALDHAKMKALENKVSFLWASNFSVGVNIFFEVNKLLASLMDEQPSYNVIMEETHHTQKKDAPSGTAITLAEQIIDNIERKNRWVKEKAEANTDLPVISHRVENVPGTHSVKYFSDIDDIEIIHTAHNRDGFALGAVLAAEFIAGKQGIFTMKDVLGIRSQL